jgi:serine O-acetyltransferase
MRYDRDTVRQWAGNSQWRACRADLARYRQHGYTGWGSEGFWALLIYRLQKVVGRWRPRWLWTTVRIALRVTKKFLSIVTLIDLHPDAEIGPGMIICHGGPVRIYAQTKIGADCAIHGACTIGAGPRPGGAVIGDHVFIGCQASVIGAVTIGDDATVAANSLVINNVPAGCTAIGVPATILPVIFRCSSRPACAPSTEPEERTSGTGSHTHSRIFNFGEKAAPGAFGLISTNNRGAVRPPSAGLLAAISEPRTMSDGPGSVPMHTKSKRYLRRQRVRQRVTTKKTTIRPDDAPEHRLALNVAKCLKQSGHN